jgi:integration host factor subunit beta
VILDEVVDALRRGDRVELRGFGVLGARIRGARKGRNPKTGAEVQLAQKVIPFFKTGKEMRARLNLETAGDALTERAVDLPGRSNSHPAT